VAAPDREVFVLLVDMPDSRSWWDVPVSEVPTLGSTQQARDRYEAHERDQRPLLTPTSG
jgi:3D-(3,5/4)-trihydroxycyclohexane-1,2-dione acylhydrolase (decyclizing)